MGPHVCIESHRGTVCLYSQFYVLEASSPLRSLHTHDAYWLQAAVMAGRRHLFMDWKSCQPPTVEVEWQQLLTKVASYERLSCRMLNKPNEYMKKWHKFLFHIDKPPEPRS